jgi:hypothetical protein
MKAIGVILSSILFLTTCLSAQKNKPFTVVAGTRVEDCIPFQEMFRYPEFIEGNIFFKNGATAVTKLNYNFLLGEMQYIQLKDTLSIANDKDVKLIVIEEDTFYFDKGYLEQIYSRNIKVALKQYFKLKEIQKKDSYGSAGSNSATDSYSSIIADGQSYKLIANHDRIYQKVMEYYLLTSSGEFVTFTRKKAIQLFPQNKKAIEAYLKSNRVDFDSREDLIRFARYLSSL